MSPDKCLARLIRDGQGVQCGNRPQKGTELCSVHAPRRGKARTRYGLVTEELSGDLSREMEDLHPRAADRPAAEPSVEGGCLRPAAAAVSSVSAETAVGGESQRPRIVTGFGSERVEDVAADEARRVSEGVQRAGRRREDGSRGRMVDLQGRELDRGAGGAWQARRR